MGTNYYFKGVHIGKVSSGWVFAMNTHPDDGIASWDDWKKVIDGDPVVNEYDEIIPFEQFRVEVEDRKHPFGLRPKDTSKLLGVSGVDRITGLFRHQIGYGSCIGHGEGSWDYMRGVF